MFHQAASVVGRFGWVAVVGLEASDGRLGLEGAVCCATSNGPIAKDNRIKICFRMTALSLAFQARDTLFWDGNCIIRLIARFRKRTLEASTDLETEIPSEVQITRPAQARRLSRSQVNSVVMQAVDQSALQRAPALGLRLIGRCLH